MCVAVSSGSVSKCVGRGRCHRRRRRHFGARVTTGGGGKQTGGKRRASLGRRKINAVCRRRRAAVSSYASVFSLVRIHERDMCARERILGDLHARRPLLRLLQRRKSLRNVGASNEKQCRLETSAQATSPRNERAQRQLDRYERRRATTSGARVCTPGDFWAARAQLANSRAKVDHNLMFQVQRPTCSLTFSIAIVSSAACIMTIIVYAR